MLPEHLRLNGRKQVHIFPLSLFPLFLIRCFLAYPSSFLFFIDKDKARGSSKSKSGERELDEAQRKVWYLLLSCYLIFFLLSVCFFIFIY